MALVYEQRAPRRTGPLVVAGLIALVLAVVAVIAFSGGGDKNRSPRDRGGQGKGGQKAATLTADNVTFHDVYGAQIPSSPAGPHNTAGGRAFGFDHSPAGAVLAAINIFARAEIAPGPTVFEPTITEQVVGPDKDKLLVNAQRAYTERAAQESTPPGGELTGEVEKGRANKSGLWAYRIDSYDAFSAAINLLLRTVQGGTPFHVNFAVTVRWSDGDWRLVAPLNGQFSSVGQQLAEVPSSYVVIGKG